MALKHSNRKLWIRPALVLLTAVLALLIAYSDPVRQLEHKVVSQLFELRGPLPVEDSPVVLVSISQQAGGEIPYKYPWPVWVYAKLIENLNKAGAKAIGIDVIFDQPDRYNPANDSLFAQALQKYGNVVLAGNIATNSQLRGGESASRSVSLVRANSVLSGANPNPPGLVRVVKDKDSVVRRYLLFQKFNAQTYYPLGLEVLRIYHKWENPPVKSAGSFFQFGTYRIPRYNANTMTINYSGGPGIFPEYSFETVIDDSTVLLRSEGKSFQINSFSDPGFGLLKEDVFRNKIVLVGATMPELHDFHATPFSPAGAMPGFEIHAHAIQTLLTGEYIKHLPVWGNLLLLLLFSLIIVCTTQKAGGVWGAVLFILLGLCAIGLTLAGFLELNYFIDLTGPLVALTAGYIITNSYEYAAEQREKRRIRAMFSSYVSPEVVNQMIASGQEPRLGGDEAFITAFFSDIESFSTFSEKLSPPALVRLMNEYLTAMTDVLTDGGGTLDKYIGDAIVAFFGAPVPRQDHAFRACVVSQLMQQKLAELRARWKSEKGQWPDMVHRMRNRIGIHTGSMVTGNLGSNRRFNYTMMGDNVNLAARCESGAKSYGVYTMVTGDTKKEAEKYGDRCVFRYLDRIVVKGRTAPVDVYEIIGLRENLSALSLECKKLFEQGIGHYQDQQWKKAAQCFRQSKEMEEHRPGPDQPLIKTNPSLVYLYRCRHMQQHPPGSEWDGIYVMESK